MVGLNEATFPVAALGDATIAPAPARNREADREGIRREGMIFPGVEVEDMSHSAPLVVEEALVFPGAEVGDVVAGTEVPRAGVAEAPVLIDRGGGTDHVDIDPCRGLVVAFPELNVRRVYAGMGGTRGSGLGDGSSRGHVGGDTACERPRLRPMATASMTAVRLMRIRSFLMLSAARVALKGHDPQGT